MSMAAQEEIEVGTGSLPIYFWRVGDQNRKLVVRYRGSCLLNVVHSIEMGVVDAGKMNAFNLRRSTTRSIAASLIST